MKKTQQKTKSKKEAEEPYHHLFEAIALIKNGQEAEKFFIDLCTPAELQAITDRWRVVEPIKQGKSYRKIHEETGVSVTTIGRVARFLTHGNGGYDIIYERLKKKNKNDTKTKNRNTEKREVK